MSSKNILFLNDESLSQGNVESLSQDKTIEGKRWKNYFSDKEATL